MKEEKVMRRITLAVMALAAMAYSAQALAADKYMLDHAHTTVGFSVKHMVITSVRGTFGEFDGTIDFDELLELRQKSIKLGAGEKMMEIFTTHPNMLKRIKHLSTLGH